MLSNYLTAALRNLARNKLLSAINLLGLSVAFAGALLIFLYVRHELTYDRWMPGHEFIYRVSAGSSGVPPSEFAPSDVAGWLISDIPEVAVVTRLFSYGGVLRHGNVEAAEDIVWADANVFDLLPFPVVAGDLRKSLQQPDGIVLTRKIARKYFGKDAPLGELIELDRAHLFHVTAVIEDLPSNTHFKFDVLAPSHAPFSLAAEQDRTPIHVFGQKIWNSWTYFRLSAGASIEHVRTAMPALLDRHVPPLDTRKASEIHLLAIVPLDDIHLGRSAPIRTAAAAAVEQHVYVATLIGLLVLSVAGINFVNLMTARVARRAPEVAIRKTVGATRRDLIAQFMSEALVCVGLAIVLALAMAEICLPFLNALLGFRIALDWHAPPLWLAIIGSALVVGTLSSIYPAFLLSSFAPAAVLNNMASTIAPSRPLRRWLVIAQFGMLIGLLIAVSVIAQQHRYALRTSMQSDSQYIFLESSCPESLKSSLASVTGVLGVACSLQTPQLGIGPGAEIQLPNGRQSGAKYTSVDFGYFEMFGFIPTAGRFFSNRYATDQSSAREIAPEALVINERAAREFGFSSPKAAVGQIISWNHVLTVVPITSFTGTHDAQIIGVVPDFLTGSLRERIPSAVFYNEPRQFNRITLKLSGQDLAGILRNLERAWKRSGEAKPFNPQFMDAQFREVYRELNQQAQLTTMAVGLAAFIACAGLLGLSIFLAEQRTKEIGIRKVMGAGTSEITRLLVWQFVKPVLWANLLAWPIAAFVMRRWLQGFAYHIELEAWLFFASAATALFIALLTISTHCYLVARAKPIAALRYE